MSYRTNVRYLNRFVLEIPHCVSEWQNKVLLSASLLAFCHAQQRVLCCSFLLHVIFCTYVLKSPLMLRCFASLQHDSFAWRTRTPSEVNAWPDGTPLTKSMLLSLALQSANIFALRSLNRNIVNLKVQSSQGLCQRVSENSFSHATSAAKARWKQRNAPPRCRPSSQRGTVFVLYWLS